MTEHCLPCRTDDRPPRNSVYRLLTLWDAINFKYKDARKLSREPGMQGRRYASHLQPAGAGAGLECKARCWRPMPSSVDTHDRPPATPARCGGHSLLDSWLVSRPLQPKSSICGATNSCFPIGEYNESLLYCGLCVLPAPSVTRTVHDQVGTLCSCISHLFSRRVPSCTSARR